jgi:short-subunit dehydrogenase
VLPGATATDFWEKSGLRHQDLPESIVMPAVDMVDAALVKLDQGEQLTTTSLNPFIAKC